MYQVSFENDEQFLSYEVRLTFCDDKVDDADVDDAKGITIARLCFLRKSDDLKICSKQHFRCGQLRRHVGMTRAQLQCLRNIYVIFFDPGSNHYPDSDDINVTSLGIF